MAAFLAYLLLLQGLVGAVAHGAMAAAASAPDLVICTSAGLARDGREAPLGRLAHECCPIACHAACAIGQALGPNLIGTVYRGPFSCVGHVVSKERSHLPCLRGLVRDARAPPAFSH